MVRILISYASYSGNTEETAELIELKLRQEGCEVDRYRMLPRTTEVPDPSRYDGLFIGSFTWHKGTTPPLVKDFVYNLGYKPPKVYVFGTGDTQFGGDQLFCRACDRLAAFYQSPVQPLKIEQSPRGAQESRVIEWTQGVIEHCKLY